jgi:hypothetical protein
VDNALTGTLRVDIISLSGSIVKTMQLQKTAEGSVQFYLQASELASGNYILKTSMTEWTQSTQIVKE